MGAGASFDVPGLLVGESASDEDRYFCHSCHRVFGLDGVANPTDFYCPHCQSTFLEEIGGSSNGIAVRHRTHGSLTTDQARRISSATAMLRLLESQLREELEQLQTAFENANARFSNDGHGDKNKKLSMIMKARLRTCSVNLDMACSQPSCPICSEDFVLGSEVLRMPCSHIFHDACVLPWLEMKQNCPICRAEISDALPTVEELEKLSVIELKAKLREVDAEEDDIFDKEKVELVELYQQKLRDSQEAERQRVLQAQQESVSLPMILPSTMLRGGGFPLMSLATSSGSSSDAMSTIHQQHHHIHGFGGRSQFHPVGFHGADRMPAMLLRRNVALSEEENEEDESETSESNDAFRPPRGFGLRYYATSNANRGSNAVGPLGSTPLHSSSMPGNRLLQHFSSSSSSGANRDEDDDDDENNDFLRMINSSLRAETNSGLTAGGPSRWSYSAGNAPSAVTYQILPRTSSSSSVNAVTSYETVPLRSNITRTLDSIYGPSSTSRDSALASFSPADTSGSGVAAANGNETGREDSAPR